MKKVYYFFVGLMLVSCVVDLLFSILDLLIPMFIASAFLIISLIVMIVLYFGFVKFRCTKCNTIFRGNRWEILFAPHTPTKRKMRCPMCNEKIWCEDYFGKIEKEKKENE